MNNALLKTCLLLLCAPRALEGMQPDVITVRESPDLQPEISQTTTSRMSAIQDQPSLTRTAESSPATQLRMLPAEFTESKESTAPRIPGLVESTESSGLTSPADTTPSEEIASHDTTRSTSSHTSVTAEAINEALLPQPDSRYLFHRAVIMGGQQAEQLLMQAIRSGECDPNQQDNHGRTLLHYAAAYGHKNIFIFLINKRNNKRLVSDTSPLDCDDQTPLCYADKFNHPEIIAALKERDTDQALMAREIYVLSQAYDADQQELIAHYHLSNTHAQVQSEYISERTHMYIIDDEFKQPAPEFAQSSSSSSASITPVVPPEIQSVAQIQQQYRNEEHKEENIQQQNNIQHEAPRIIPIQQEPAHVIIDMQQLPQTQLNNFMAAPRQHRQHRAQTTHLREVCLWTVLLTTIGSIGTTLGVLYS